MSIVSNTGPLIALAKIDQLRLLPALYSSVLIAPIVHRELLAKSGAETDRLDTALATFLRVTDLSEVPVEVQAVTQALDPGEQGAVCLAHQLKSPLLIDDRLGRLAAQRLGLSFTGTVGVILLSKKANLIPLVKPVLEQIRENGYWLADELIGEAAKLAGE